MKSGDIKKILSLKSGQVWIETVIYTLITIVLIGLALGYVKPKIEAFQDRTRIERAFNLMKEIDNSIEEIVNEGSGNQRVIEFSLTGGMLEINSTGDSLRFKIKSSYEYSESGKNFTQNNFIIKTENYGKDKMTEIIREYDYDITYNGQDELRQISASTSTYKILLSNKGLSGNKYNVDIKII